MGALPRALFANPSGRGRRLYIHHAGGAGQARGSIVYVHPWAEEMNKSRSMVATMARQLREQRYEVMTLDLEGCGDSAGDFGDATWERWTDDVLDAIAWLRQQGAGGPLWLWGLRAGTLLATAAARRAPEPCHLLLWQPALQGRQVLQQFLRLRTAAQWTSAGPDKAATPSPQAELKAGRATEIAGYRLSPALASGLEQARLEPTGLAPGRLVWLDVATAAGPASPAGIAAQDAWRAAGWQVDAQVVQGPAFWQTTEIEPAPELARATLDALSA
jgi:exosortase A-associated hydrolase 2